MLVIGGKDPDEWDTEAKKSADTDLLHEARKIRIVFETNSSYEPVIANMVLNFGTPVNILRANTRNVEGTARGDMILGLPDDEDLQERMIAWLKEKKLSVSEVTEDV
jgi:D-methionine transport system ATP-binding protein